MERQRLPRIGNNAAGHHHHDPIRVTRDAATSRSWASLRRVLTLHHLLNVGFHATVGLSVLLTIVSAGNMRTRRELGNASA
jgi:hypothetical protein